MDNETMKRLPEASALRGAAIRYGTMRSKAKIVRPSGELDSLEEQLYRAALLFAKAMVDAGAIAAALLLLFVAACHPASSGVTPAITFTSSGVKCSWDLLAPITSMGASDTTFGPDGEECVPPEGGPAFGVGFGWHGLVMKVSVPRPARDEFTHFDASEIGLYLNTPSGWCVDWIGIVSVLDANDWLVGVDATCSTNTTMKLIAQFEGTNP